MKSIRNACSSRVRAMRDQDAAAGFTLVELLIVVAIIAILAAIAIPVYLVNLNNAHEAAVKSTLQSVQTKIGADLAQNDSADVATITKNASTDDLTVTPVHPKDTISSSSTNYCISGEWGSGTTYYITQDGTVSKTACS